MRGEYWTVINYDLPTTGDLDDSADCATYVMA